MEQNKISLIGGNIMGGKRISQDEFNTQLKLKNPNLVLVGLYSYKGNKTRFRCLLHNYDFDTTPERVLLGMGCKYCKSDKISSSKMLTHDMFLKKCLERFEDMDDYIFTSEYSGVINKIEFVHKICGKKHSSLPCNFLKGHRCKYCLTNSKKLNKIKSQEKYRVIVSETTNEEYSLINFNGNAEKSTLIHYLCGNTFDMLIGNFVYAGQRCPICAKENAKVKIRKTNEEFLNELHEHCGYDYEPLEEYCGIKNKMKVRHIPCGNISEITPDSLLNNTHKYCMYCIKYENLGRRPTETRNFATNYPNFLKNWDYYKNLKSPFDYTPNSGKVVWWICDNGHSFEKSIRVVTNGRLVCPYCPSLNSLGETKIKEILNENKIEFNPENIFDDCFRSKYSKLRFDFYLHKYNMAIEYDGIQHFEPVDFYHKGIEFAKRQFEDLKIRDKMKNDYCFDNNINLVRIPYWDFDRIEDIVLSKLKIGGVSIENIRIIK